MILSDSEIIKEMENGNIVVTPFDRKNLGSNSIDLHLSNHVAIYNSSILDAALDNSISRLEIPHGGLILLPNELYLCSTVEYTETLVHVPIIEGKSSVGRLGLNIHATAGYGDVGFKNHWTLEIFVVKPVRVYAGMPIAQIYYQQVKGIVLEDYSEKLSAKYNKVSVLPQPSKMHENFSGQDKR